MADEMMQEIVTKARHELQTAQEVADNTPRPANACPAHDSQFALTKALTGGVDTLLMISQQGMRNSMYSADSGKLGMIFSTLQKPWPWIAISIASFSPNFPSIVEAIKAVTQ